MLFFYQGFSKVPCVYEIINTHSGRRYVGQAKEPKSRWIRGHKESLLRNVHKNQYMQHDYNKCFAKLGHSDFLEFHILEPLPDSLPEQRDEREQYWITERVKICELYNLTSGGQANNVLSNQTKQKISETKKKFYQTAKGKALIEKLAADRTGKTYEEQYGAEKALEVKQKIRDNKLVEMNRPEVKENLRQQLKGKTNVERYGQTKATEVKAKQSIARKGKYTGADSSRFKMIDGICLQSPSGTVYTSIEGIKEFAELHGLSRNHLSELLSGKRKTHHGWQLVIVKG